MNTGKRFETDFKNSVPEGVYYKKLADPAIGFDISSSTQRFSPKPPYDAVACKNGRMFALELKSSATKSMSFEGKSPNIKQEQVDNLILAEDAGAVAGLVLHFSKLSETYFVKASVFKKTCESLNKKSINVSEVREIGLPIPTHKRKVSHWYELDILFNMWNNATDNKISTER